MRAPRRVVLVRTLRELARLVSDDPAIQPVGGGTLIVPSWQDTSAPEAIVALTRIRQLRQRSGCHCGSAVTLAEIAGDTGVPAALRQAAASVERPAVRTMATVGGNVAAASPGCLAVALLALRARAAVLAPGTTGDLDEVALGDVIGRSSPVIAGFGWPGGGSQRSCMHKAMVRSAAGPVVATVVAACSDDAPGTVAIGGAGIAPQRLVQAEAAWAAEQDRPALAAVAASEAAAAELSARAGEGPGGAGQDAHRRAVVATLIRRAVAAASSSLGDAA